MDPLLDYRARLLDRLQAAVPELVETIGLIPEDRWLEPPGPGRRSAHAIVARLRDTERDAYLHRLRRLLKDDSPSFEPYDPPNWEVELYNPGEPMEVLLRDYATLREAELQLLRPLLPEGWARAGRHPSFGMRTVQWWTERILEFTQNSLNELRLT
jgi:hypothetical protein